MSLAEAYTLAHCAQSRLQRETRRPDRNLRFVVGHLLHYESARLRIVAIEHGLSRENSPPPSARSSPSVEEQDDEALNPTLSLQRFPSASSPQPPLSTADEDVDDAAEVEDSDEDSGKSSDDDADDADDEGGRAFLPSTEPCPAPAGTRPYTRLGAVVGAAVGRCQAFARSSYRSVIAGAAVAASP